MCARSVARARMRGDQVTGRSPQAAACRRSMLLDCNLPQCSSERTRYWAHFGRVAWHSPGAPRGHCRGKYDMQPPSTGAVIRGVQPLTVALASYGRHLAPRFRTGTRSFHFHWSEACYFPCPPIQSGPRILRSFVHPFRRLSCVSSRSSSPPSAAFCRSVPSPARQQRAGMGSRGAPGGTSARAWEETGLPIWIRRAGIEKRSVIRRMLASMWTPLLKSPATAGTTISMRTPEPRSSFRSAAFSAARA